MITISKSEVVITTLSNYLETGVIQPDEIDRTMITLMAYKDQELFTSLVESHIVREQLYALRNFRNLN